METHINPERNGAFVILENKKAEVCLVEHAYGGKKFGLPGGGVGLGEIAAKAAVREGYEETGFIFTVASMSLVAVLTPQLRYGLDLLFHCDRLVEDLVHEPSIINHEEIASVGFFSLEAVESIREKLYPAQFRLIMEHYHAYKKTGRIVLAQL